MEIVTISGYRLAQNQEGESFVVLELMGDVELVQSSVTGRFYATAKKASITSTFSPEIADRLIGKELPGKVQRVACEPYSYVVPETGEEIVLEHRWDYIPANANLPIAQEVIPEGSVEELV